MRPLSGSTRRASSGRAPAAPAPPRTVVVISQVYVPDPAAAGQHLADVAAELARRGHRVVVYTGDRGYETPSIRYSAHEVRDGVEVRRLPCSSFGKRSLFRRLAGAAGFVVQATLRTVFLRDLDTLIVSTSPPLALVAALAIARLRRVRLKFWIMDLNPDQAVALGILREGGLVARAFDALQRWLLAAAEDVIVLDRFMADRVRRKLDVSPKLRVVPPWAHEQHLENIPHERNPFRTRFGLEERVVVMYSGNHTPANPLTTLLEAATRLRGEPRLAFVFVGGGLAKAEVERCAGPNVLSLPYQPLDELRFSLSAADVHVVTLGDAMGGILHPCKVYGAMAVGRPVLYFGPERSHIADLIRRHNIGWVVRHGDPARAEAAIRRLMAMGPSARAAMGARARSVLERRFSRERLCGQVAAIVERGATTPPPRYLRLDAPRRRHGA